MKTLLAMVAALALATPALAWDNNDEIREQGREAQQQLQDMANANAWAMQQRQQAQQDWAWRCAARNYQNCY
jgi:hypothetical protein